MKRSRWVALFWVIPAVLIGMAIIVLLANWLRGLPSVKSFMTTYPGQSALPASAPVGFPAWVEWQHFLNAFFLLFIVRTGWQIRQKKRPTAFWTRKNSGVIRTTNPPVRIGIHVWLHLSMDILWTLNGILFFILIFATGQWMRLVPLSWDIIPNAVSVGIQYASLHWPHDDGWTNYNALQTLSYFVTVFIAAPLALITGIRMSPGFAARLRPLDRVFPTRVARAIHYPVMVYFVGFTIVHVTLVLATGALRNLNHMYAGRDDETWWGFGIFAASLVLMAVAWVGLKPRVLDAIAGVSGTVIRR
jgi:thiosulfate reductase cytochrome b subunit